jgi:hypothetical protein
LTHWIFFVTAQNDSSDEEVISSWLSVSAKGTDFPGTQHNSLQALSPKRAGPHAGKNGLESRAIPLAGAAPFARLSTPGQEAVRIGQPETTKTEPGVFRQMNQTASQAGTGKLILGGRVTGNRIQSFVARGNV